MYSLRISTFQGWERCLNQLPSASASRKFHSSFLSSQEESQQREVVSDDFFESNKPKELTEDEIQAKRNKSRLRPAHFRKVNGEIPYETPSAWFHNTLRYKRKVYATFGEKSGINPGIQWPTHDQLKKRLEYESVAYPFTIQEMIANVKEKRRLEQEAFEKRTQELEIKAAAIEKTIQEVLDKRAAKEKEVLKSQERKEKMMEEVRRHFGYTMDPRDDRFKELLEKKEKEEKKRSKEAKKLEKERKMLENLQKKSAAAVEKSQAEVKQLDPSE